MLAPLNMWPGMFHAGAGDEKESTEVKVMSANGFSRFIARFGLAFR